MWSVWLSETLLASVGRCFPLEPHVGMRSNQVCSSWQLNLTNYVSLFADSLNKIDIHCELYGTHKALDKESSCSGKPCFESNNNFRLTDGNKSLNTTQAR